MRIEYRPASIGQCVAIRRERREGRQAPDDGSGEDADDGVCFSGRRRGGNSRGGWRRSGEQGFASEVARLLGKMADRRCTFLWRLVVNPWLRKQLASAENNLNAATTDMRSPIQ